MQRLWPCTSAEHHSLAVSSSLPTLSPPSARSLVVAKCVYRDWLCALSSSASRYVAQVSHKRHTELYPQMIALYDLAQEVGQADFLAALELAAEQRMYGAEYVRAILSPPPSSSCHDQTPPSLVEQLRALAPTQVTVERDLAQYEQYVANRVALAQEAANEQIETRTQA